VIDELDDIAPKTFHCLAIADFDGHREEEHAMVDLIGKLLLAFRMR
jgi:hypothetical protein